MAKFRFWLKDHERKPDPKPVQTNDRKAILTGIVLWIVGLAVALAVFWNDLSQGSFWFWTITAGIGLGIFGLFYTAQWLKKEALRAAAEAVAETNDSRAPEAS